jgi:hypothetical protein
LELSQRIKQLSPSTKVLARYFTGKEPPSVDWAAIDRNIEWIDCIEDQNETIATGDPDGTRRAVDYAVQFSNDVQSRYGGDLATCLLNVAVGNPDEVHLLRPVAEVAVKNDDYISYHGYFPCSPGHPEWYDHPEVWPFHHMRWMEWDKYFNSVGLRPKYLLTEMGAIGTSVRPDGLPGSYNAAAGWRWGGCLNGDWPEYKRLLVQYRNDLKAWNRVNNNRCEAATIFTIGASHVGWEFFKLWKGELEDLARVLTE